VDNFCHIFFHRRFFETRKDHMKKTMLKLGVRSQHDFPVLTCLNQQWKFCQRTAGPELAPYSAVNMVRWKLYLCGQMLPFTLLVATVLLAAWKHSGYGRNTAETVNIVFGHCFRLEWLEIGFRLPAGHSWSFCLMQNHLNL